MSYADWRGRFLEAVDESLYPVEWLDWLVETGNARFWGTDLAAILVEARQYPSGLLEVHGLVAAGELDEIKRLVPLAENWGRSIGAKRASITSGWAWAKLLKSAGYRPETTTIAKEL